MADPTATTAAGIVTISVALLGPLVGPYVVICLAAFAGALWALAAAPTRTRTEGLLLVLRLVLTAVLLTVAIAYAIERTYEWPLLHTLAPIAFLVGLGGERWQAFGRFVVQLLQRRLGGGS